MDICVFEPTKSGELVWRNRPGSTPQDLARLLSEGHPVTAMRKQLEGELVSEKFLRADVLMVSISLDVIDLKTALGATFVDRYGTVAAYSGELDGNDEELILAFALPEPVIDVKTYDRLLAGLETLFAGACHHHCAEQMYATTKSGAAKILGRALDAKAVQYLDKLGLEAKEIAKGKGGFVRSFFTLNKETKIALKDGVNFLLGQLPKDTEVFCPLHVDIRPRAVVHWFGDGTPGIQCMHCNRTFASSTTSRDYDFEEFDRVVKGLAAVEGERILVGGVVELNDRSITYFTEDYLPALDYCSGVMFVKSPKGTGKTEVLKRYVANCKKQHLRVLVVGHRRALLQSMAERLGIRAYFSVDSAPHLAQKGRLVDQLLDGGSKSALDGEPEGEHRSAVYRRVEPKSYYAVCLDSMKLLDPSDKDHQYDVVIIDESEQVFSHLIGDTLKRHRREVFARLKYYLRAASSIVFLDADLNKITVEAATLMLDGSTPVSFVINEPKSAKGEVKVYPDSGHMAAELVSRVGRGEKTFVATNSLKKALDLEKLLATRCPGRCVAVITSKNSQQEDTQALLMNIAGRFERDLDVLIASPAIGTGIDITFKDGSGESLTVVKNVFGFFEGNITTHFDIDQQLMRVRNPGEVHVWVNSRVMNYETDVDCIKRELEKTARQSAYLLRYDDTGVPVYADDEGLLNIWARVQASSRGSKNKLAGLFNALRVSNNWNIVNVEIDKLSSQMGKDALLDAKNLRQEEHKVQLLTANKLDEADADELAKRDQKGDPLTDQQHNALERWRIEAFYGEGGICSDLINFDEEGRTRENVRRLECLLSRREWFSMRDRKDLADNVVMFDRKRYLVQRDLLGGLFSDAGLYDPVQRRFNSEVTVEKATLSMFLDSIELRRRQIEAVFSFPVNLDRRRNPVSQLKSLLRLVGLRLVEAKVDQSGGKKIRRYRLDEERLAALMSVIKRREQKFWRVTEAEDTLGSNNANAMQSALSKGLSFRDAA